MIYLNDPSVHDRSVCPMCGTFLGSLEYQSSGYQSFQLQAPLRLLGLSHFSPRVPMGLAGLRHFSPQVSLLGTAPSKMVLADHWVGLEDWDLSFAVCFSACSRGIPQIHKTRVVFFVCPWGAGYPRGRSHFSPQVLGLVGLSHVRPEAPLGMAKLGHFSLQVPGTQSVFSPQVPLELTGLGHFSPQVPSGLGPPEWPVPASYWT